MKLCVILCVIGWILGATGSAWRARPLKPLPSTGGGGTPGAAARGEVN